MFSQHLQDVCRSKVPALSVGELSVECKVVVYPLSPTDLNLSKFTELWSRGTKFHASFQKQTNIDGISGGENFIVSTSWVGFAEITFISMSTATTAVDELKTLRDSWTVRFLEGSDGEPKMMVSAMKVSDELMTSDVDETKPLLTVIHPTEVVTAMHENDCSNDDDMKFSVSCNGDIQPHACDHCRQQFVSAEDLMMHRWMISNPVTACSSEVFRDMTTCGTDETEPTVQMAESINTIHENENDSANDGEMKFSVSCNGVIQPNACNHCGQKFMFAEDLMMHRWTIHNPTSGCSSEFFRDTKTCGIEESKPTIQPAKSINLIHDINCSDDGIYIQPRFIHEAAAEQTSFLSPGIRRSCRVMARCSGFVTSTASLKKHACTVCGKYFLGRKYAAQHALKHGAQRRLYSCTYCIQQYVTELSLLRHHQQQHPLLKGPDCMDALSLKVRQADIKAQWHLKKAKVCRIYKKSFADGSGRNRRKWRSCSICIRRFCNSRSLRYHRKKYHEDGTASVECSTGRNSKGDAGSGEADISNIDDTGHLSCSYCGSHFTSINKLNIHRTQFHSPMGKNLQVCKQCGKSIKRNYMLTHIMETHNGEKPYACERCGMLFTWRTALKKHASKRSCVAPVSAAAVEASKSVHCRVCGRAFATEAETAKHFAELCRAIENKLKDEVEGTTD